MDIIKRLSVYEKKQFSKISKNKADKLEYQMSLQLLSLMLYKHYGEKVIIIIDEYDTPIQQAYSCGFYSDAVNFIRGVFSGGLKDNPYLAYGFLTGVMETEKESVFSGLNSLKMNYAHDTAYSQYFGFTRV